MRLAAESRRQIHHAGDRGIIRASLESEGAKRREALRYADAKLWARYFDLRRNLVHDSACPRQRLPKELARLRVKATLGSDLRSAKNTAPVLDLEHAIACSDEKLVPLLEFLSGTIELPPRVTNEVWIRRAAVPAASVRS